MYCPHFGLREQPFALTPNTHFFLQLPSHQEALNLLLMALDCGDGFIRITGEVGTGKTLLCRTLLKQLDADPAYRTAYIPDPSLSPDDFRAAFAHELGCLPNAAASWQQQISARLLELAEHAKLVLVIDEAQTMPVETLEALRLLTNLETETRKLFQVVLLGQPELDELLARHELRQLEQRITFSYQLRPLNRTEAQAYLAQRLARADYTGVELFKPAAARLLWKASGGIPRRLNILAHKALLAAYGAGYRQVSTAEVRKAIADNGCPRVKPRTGRWLLACIALVLLVLGGFYTRGLL